ncbi:hypothetical protein H9X77_07470, partial [Clostridium saudiense]|nr:hypothetical protein [Clostridium saudiense]
SSLLVEGNTPSFTPTIYKAFTSLPFILAISPILTWSYESVFKYVKSGLIKLDQYLIDKLENYILANGIKGFKWTRDLYEFNEEDVKILKDFFNI